MIAGYPDEIFAMLGSTASAVGSLDVLPESVKWEWRRKRLVREGVIPENNFEWERPSVGIGSRKAIQERARSPPSLVGC